MDFGSCAPLANAKQICNVNIIPLWCFGFLFFSAILSMDFQPFFFFSNIYKRKSVSQPPSCLDQLWGFPGRPEALRSEVPAGPDSGRIKKKNHYSPQDSHNTTNALLMYPHRQICKINTSCTVSAIPPAITSEMATVAIRHRAQRSLLALIWLTCRPTYRNTYESMGIVRGEPKGCLIVFFIGFKCL